MPWSVLARWCRQLWNDVVAASGYKIAARLAVTVAALWISLYTIESSRYEFAARLAQDEGNRIVALASSGNAGFVSAMVEFNNIRRETAEIFPGFFFWRTEVDRPNEVRLNEWASRYFSRCVSELCGDDDYRIRLDNVDLSYMDLRGVDLNQADLRDATLTCADLRGADLRSSNVRGTTLTNTDLRGANLRLSLYWEAEQLKEAAYWNATTQWPVGFEPAQVAVLPVPDDADSCNRTFGSVPTTNALSASGANTGSPP